MKAKNREHKRLLALVVRTPFDWEPWGDESVNGDYTDCSQGCRWYRPLEGDLAWDWGVCTNPKSHRCGLLTFEHQGCRAYDGEQS